MMSPLEIMVVADAERLEILSLVNYHRKAWDRIGADVTYVPPGRTSTDPDPDLVVYYRLDGQLAHALASTAQMETKRLVVGGERLPLSLAKKLTSIGHREYLIRLHDEPERLLADLGLSPPPIRVSASDGGHHLITNRTVEPIPAYQYHLLDILLRKGYVTAEEYMGHERLDNLLGTDRRKTLRTYMSEIRGLLSERGVTLQSTGGHARVDVPHSLAWYLGSQTDHEKRIQTYEDMRFDAVVGWVKGPDSERIPLTVAESQLLSAFLRHPGQIVQGEDIVSWMQGVYSSSKVQQRNAHALMHKLHDVGIPYITNVQRPPYSLYFFDDFDPQASGCLRWQGMDYKALGAYGLLHSQARFDILGPTEYALFTFAAAYNQSGHDNVSIDKIMAELDLSRQSATRYVRKVRDIIEVLSGKQTLTSLREDRWVIGYSLT